MVKKKQPVIVEDDSDDEDVQFVVGKSSVLHCLLDWCKLASSYQRSSKLRRWRTVNGYVPHVRGLNPDVLTHEPRNTLSRCEDI